MLKEDKIKNLITRFSLIAITLIAVLVSPLISTVSAALNRDEAINILISDVIDPSPHRDVLVAYGLQNLLHPGDTVAPYLDGSATTISTDTWFFWVDNEPSYWFAHSANFVFIDASTGDVEVQDVEWWPVVNGTETWGSLTERLTTPDRVYGEIPIQELGGAASTRDFQDIEGERGFVEPMSPGGTGAILVGGTNPSNPAESAVAGEDIDNMESALKNNDTGPGVPSGNITKLPDATEGQLDNALKEIAKKNYDKLYFHFTGHGNGNVIVLRNGNTFITGKKLDEKLKGKAKKINITIESCRSGGLIPALRESGFPGSVVTATDETHAARFYPHYEDTNGNGQYDPGEPVSGHSKFTKAFLDALKNKDVDTDGDGKVSYKEAHAFVEKKFKEDGQKQNPQYEAWGAMKWSLVEGLNMVALTYAPFEPLTAYDLGAEIGDAISEIIHWNPELQMYQTVIFPGEGQPPIGDNFEIMPGGAYFVNAKTPSEWTSTGFRLDWPVLWELYLVVGLNGISAPYLAQKAMCAYALLEELQRLGHNAREVTRWNAATQLFESFIWPDIGEKFQILPNEGYFVRIE